MDKINLGGSIVTSGWGIADGFLGASAKFDSEGNYKKENSMNTTDRFVNGGLSTITSTLGIIGDAGKLDYNRRKRAQTVDKRKKTALTYSSVKSGISMFGNFMKLGSGISTLSESNDESKMASSVMSGLSSLAGFASNVTTLIGDARAKYQRNQLIEKLGVESAKADPFGLGDDVKRRALEAQKGTATFPGALKRYNTYKAKKYALAQAKEMNEANRSNHLKGSISSGVSFLSSFGSIAKLFNDVGHTKWGTAIGGFMPALGLTGNLIEKAVSARSEHNQKKRRDAVKERQIDAYLLKKRQTVANDADQAFGPHVNIQMSTEEKDRVTLARLGANIEIINAPINTDQKHEAFEHLNMKRAKEIMNSDEKDDLLGYLGLDTTANVDQVAQALKGE